MRMYRAAATATALASLVAASPVHAQGPVAVCDALSLYANGASSRLCKGLSPTTQNLWVCALSDGAPDIHVTFNAATALHVTVREQGCEGNSRLTGTYPSVAGNALRRAPGQPAAVCGVNIDNYVQRLTAVPQILPAVGQNRVQTAILNALAEGRVTAGVAQTYIATAAAQHC